MNHSIAGDHTQVRPQQTELLKPCHANLCSPLSFENYIHEGTEGGVIMKKKKKTDEKDKCKKRV